MLFNSYIYLLLFLPVVAIGFHLLRGMPVRVSVSFLVAASLIYYGCWDWSNLWIIGGSCVFNFLCGRALLRLRGSRPGGLVLAGGVVANLGLLGFFKYSGFLAKAAVSLGAGGLPVPELVLPLGISFFTFQQIAYLVDVWRGEAEEYHVADYLLFVTFFPQLIAGPIVHHREILPQFVNRRARGLVATDLAVGSTILFIGLFKKVVLADYLARTVNPLFELAHEGARAPTFGEAWAAALAYTLQIYFDFSGYSDMAVGSARLFGIKLPVNFHSPYKAVSVIDFWRRWHITLSRFLRDYLYIPLGGNRRGPARRYVNLLLTMLIGGFWHGAGWTYLLWGGLHGVYLCVNHGWHALRRRMGWAALPRAAAVVLTFLAVVVAWVPFRAGAYELGGGGSMTAALDTAGAILRAMAGLDGFVWWPPDAGMVASDTRAWRPILLGLLLVFLFPNTQQFMRRYFPALGLGSLPDAARGPKRRWQWRPTLPWLAFSLVVLYAVGRNFDQISEFIYFQF